MSEHALLPAPARRRWLASGLTPLQEKIFNWIALVVISLFVSGWTISVISVYESRSSLSGEEAEQTPPRPMAVSNAFSSALLDPQTPKAPFIADAALTFLDPLRGQSGALRAAFRLPGSPVAAPRGEALGAEFEGSSNVVPSPDFTAPDRPGLYKVAVTLNEARRKIDDLSLITLVPFGEKRSGRIGTYQLGSWPYERGGQPRSERYANPPGFIEVTPENRNTHVSEHFRLGDFLTKDQSNVWPKYLLLDPKLLDKLELTIQELERRGHDVRHVQVMSGFRTPRYNHSGGNTAGRANLSRHMYGDAADIFIDNDRNGNMDDLNRDGRIDPLDADLIRAAAEVVEKQHPSLVGGIGVYSACCGHGPFTHIDVRGYRARWRGTGNG